MMETSLGEEEISKGTQENIDLDSNSSIPSEELNLDGDYYQLLGVSREATEKEINVAYKKLALKYHPDRSEDKEAAEVKFRALNDAYHTLIDPNKRRQYDLKGEKVGSSDVETVDVSTLGGIGRVFGAMISKLGIPIPTQISQDILATAQAICKNGGIDSGGPPLDPRVSDLTWGWALEGKVDRQSGAFYRLTVDIQRAESGFLINCRSHSRGKFKLILFDKEGSVLYQEESLKDKDKNYTQSTLFFTNFDTYRLGEVFQTERGNNQVPQVFNRLDNFLLSKRKLSPGQYLVCVYGDNFIGKTNFNIIAVPAKNDSSEVHSLEEIDESLLETKSLLNALKTDYIAAKTAYEAVLSKIKTEEEKLDKSLNQRERLYNNYIDNSITVFAPAESAKQHTQQGAPESSSNQANSENVEHQSTLSDEASQSVTSTEGSTNSNASRFAFLSAHTLATATALSSTAAQTATAASGWIARRFSFGLPAMGGKPGTKSEDGVSEDNAPSNIADAGDGSVVSDNEPIPSQPEDIAPVVQPSLSVESVSTSATSSVAESSLVSN